ncbi:phosphoribulokinase [Novimethylophilus kurashikiensis]|uniref:Phosphoribulokinase n=1 Tax=Novimethylophilus kurashikiensis TaxID=1825523 RepID=A0A2R5FBM2_9PROT|nr:phosphoribulokinase [Novimethylophilus kurashikiensis]GBG14948.1 phosphoribulokinase [Novimethylophilus kurashikiensis]
MSSKHPVIAVTGSSGAGTTTVKRAFENIFRRENLKAALIEGDSLHSLDRAAFRVAADEAAKAGNNTFSHFGPEANHFDKIEETFRKYGETGTCKRRYYIHSDAEAAEQNQHFSRTDLKPGTFTPWEDIEADSDLLLYEGLHGLATDGTYDMAKYVDLGIGVVPVVNLEWIQKIHRDKIERGYSAEATVDTIMRRMPDYIKFIVPQFSRTHINFQRVATVDTSNPFVARDIPTPDESFVVVRFRYPKGVDFPYMLKMIPNSFMSRANTLVVPGGKMSHAMEVILTPIMHDLIEKKKL